MFPEKDLNKYNLKNLSQSSNAVEQLILESEDFFADIDKCKDSNKMIEAMMLTLQQISSFGEL